MDISKNFITCQNSDAVIILMLGSGGSTPLTKGVAKWLVGQGVSVLPLGPEKGVVGYHSFPLERVEEAIGELKNAAIAKSAFSARLSRRSPRLRRQPCFRISH